MKTLYNLTQQECIALVNCFDGDTGKLAIVLWNKHKASTLEIAMKKAIKIKKFAAIQN
jgi:hypothetical protein